MIGLFHEVSLGCRSLLKKRAFLLVATLNLALGISVSTVTFSFVNAILLNPLPYPDSRQIVRFYRTVPPPAQGCQGQLPQEREQNPLPKSVLWRSLSVQIDLIFPAQSRTEHLLLEVLATCGRSKKLNIRPGG